MDILLEAVDVSGLQSFMDFIEEHVGGKLTLNDMGQDEQEPFSFDFGGETVSGGLSEILCCVVDAGRFEEFLEWAGKTWR